LGHRQQPADALQKENLKNSARLVKNSAGALTEATGVVLEGGL
jgi:hypothetical protein